MPIYEQWAFVVSCIDLLTLPETWPDYSESSSVVFLMMPMCSHITVSTVFVVSCTDLLYTNLCCAPDFCSVFFIMWLNLAELCIQKIYSQSETEQEPSQGYQVTKISFNYIERHQLKNIFPLQARYANQETKNRA